MGKYDVSKRSLPQKYTTLVRETIETRFNQTAVEDEYTRRTRIARGCHDKELSCDETTISFLNFIAGGDFGKPNV